MIQQFYCISEGKAVAVEEIPSPPCSLQLYLQQPDGTNFCPSRGEWVKRCGLCAQWVLLVMKRRASCHLRPHEGPQGFLLSEDDRGRQLLYDLTMLNLKAKSFLNEIFTKDQICDKQRQA